LACLFHCPNGFLQPIADSDVGNFAPEQASWEKLDQLTVKYFHFLSPIRHAMKPR
jgi:hypothetical protein